MEWQWQRSPGYKEQGSIPEPELVRREAFEGKTLKFLAWNVGGLRAFLKSRIPDLQKAVELGAPDVFGIMEHKLTDTVEKWIVYHYCEVKLSACYWMFSNMF